MTCPDCGAVAVCAGCGTPLQESTRSGGIRDLITTEGSARAPRTPTRGQTFLVVARGHGDLLEQLKEVVGDLGWVRLVEDRRHDDTILPREGRAGTVHIGRDIGR